MSAFGQIQAAILSCLVAAPALADGRVYADKSRPLASGLDSAISVRMDISSAQSINYQTLDWGTVFNVECYARATETTDRASAIDALLSGVWQRLSALDVLHLGVASVTLLPQIDWQYDDADTLIGCAVIRLQVQHRTPFATLEPWA